MSASSKKKLRKEQNAAVMTEKQLQEQKEAKKLKGYTIGFAVVMILVVCIALGVAANSLIGRSGIIQRNTHAATIGEHELNSAQMSYYYIDAINSAYSEWNSAYGDYTSMYMQLLYGLDLTAPLNEQNYDTEGKVTWAEYFADTAFDNAKSVYAMYDKAMADGHTLTDAEKQTIETTISNTEMYATLLYGYSDVKDYLKAVYGPGASEETYREYLETTALAQSYYDAHQASLTYEDADLQAYDAEHAKDFNSYSYTSFYMPVSDFLTGGTVTEGENGENSTVTYSDEEKAAAQAAAKEAAEKLAASGAADKLLLDKNIAQIDVYKDDDTATSTQATDVLYSSIASMLVDWISDDSRKVGDLGVVPYESTSTDADGKETTTVNGYYVVLFEGVNDNTLNLVNVRHILAAFEGGTTDSTTGVTTYSDEEKAKAKTKLEEVLSTWESGEKTEESFAALVAENSDDTGSTGNGGLYEDVYPGQMVTAFNDWCFDESRKTGDYEIVETEYGYHLMYFVGTSDTTYRNFMIENTLISNDMESWYTGIVEAATATLVDTSKLDLDFIIAPSTTY